MKLLLGMYNLCQIRKELLYRLLKSLYGLKQSERLCNQNIIAFYKRISFRQLNGDPSILIYCLKDEISIVSMYVDNFLLASSIMKTLNALKQFLARKYDTKDLGEVKTIIKWQIEWDTTASMMKIHQLAFILDPIIKKGLTNCNANVIPMKAGSSIEISDLENYEEADLHIYQKVVKKLIYLSCSTRPDISLVVKQLSKHNADLRKRHL